MSESELVVNIQVVDEATDVIREQMVQLLAVEILDKVRPTLTWNQAESAARIAVEGLRPRNVADFVATP